MSRRFYVICNECISFLTFSCPAPPPPCCSRGFPWAHYTLPAQLTCSKGEIDSQFHFAVSLWQVLDRGGLGACREQKCESELIRPSCLFLSQTHRIMNANSTNTCSGHNRAAQEAALLVAAQKNVGTWGWVNAALFFFLTIHGSSTLGRRILIVFQQFSCLGFFYVSGF